MLASLAVTAEAQQPVRRLPLAVFRDKMQGGWLGQMIGVGWGAAHRVQGQGGHHPGRPDAALEPGHGQPARQRRLLRRDDVHEDAGDLRLRRFHPPGRHRLRQQRLSALARQQRGPTNLRRGIAPPDSSHPQFNKCADDIDYQIESDFSGIISPGMPNQVIALSEIFGRLMNYGDGRYAGQFVGGMYAEAYFESDMVKIIRAGLACVPAESQYAEMVRDVLKWYGENPADWEKTWQWVEDKYHKDPKYTHGLCSKPGGNGAFSIDAKLNGAYVLIGLLYGQGDPDRTMRIACRCGQDSDCNPANAGGIYFAMLGAAKIPPRFVEKLNLSAKYSHTDYTVPKVYEVSEMLVRKAVVRAGGRIESDANGEVLVIPVQTPKPGLVERSDAPGRIADSRFRPEEMAKITARPDKAAKP